MKKKVTNKISAKFISFLPPMFPFPMCQRPVQPKRATQKTNLSS